MTDPRDSNNATVLTYTVFVVSSTDPTPYIKCCVHLDGGQTGLYVRGDDMPQFPGRSLCEQSRDIWFLNKRDQFNPAASPASGKTGGVMAGCSELVEKGLTQQWKCIIL